MDVLYTLTKGDSFNFSADFTDDNDAPLTGASANLSCEVRSHDDALYGTFTITEPNSNGTYLFTLVPYGDWKTAIDQTLEINIKYNVGGQISHTKMFGLAITREGTQ